MIVPGAEFTVPDSWRAREMAIPLDDAAHAAVERAKAATAQLVKQQEDEGRRQGPQPRRAFRTLPDHTDTKPAPDEQQRVGKDEVVLSPTSARKQL